MKGNLMGKLVATILVVIFSFYLIINALVPELDDWASDLSTVNNTDYGWVVYLIFLIIMFAVAYAVIRKVGLAGKV